MDFEISGSYPIILDGETAGDLTVTREGLFWSFEAKCELRREIVRLSVYGEGKEGYLGIMEPFGDMLKLGRKFSRAALKDFPARISHAGQKGEQEIITPAAPEFVAPPTVEIKPELIAPPTAEASQEVCEAPVEPEAHSSSDDSPLSCDSDADIEAHAPPEDYKPPPEEPAPPPIDIIELDWRPCAIPCSLFSGIKEKRVCSNITGALIAQVGEYRLLAVPNDVALSLPDPNAVQFVDEIHFSDEKYLICVIKNGKSVSEF